MQLRLTETAKVSRLVCLDGIAFRSPSGPMGLYRVGDGNTCSSCLTLIKAMLTHKAKDLGTQRHICSEVENYYLGTLLQRSGGTC